MAKKQKIPLSQQIETIITPDRVESDAGNAPIPADILSHLETFFSELKIEELPEFDLTTQEGALAAQEYSKNALSNLQSKMAQIEVLKQALLSAPLSQDKILK